ncbi:MAG: hypothetical protein ACP5O4_04040 [bacterium]
MAKINKLNFLIIIIINLIIFLLLIKINYAQDNNNTYDIKNSKENTILINQKYNDSLKAYNLNKGGYSSNFVPDISFVMDFSYVNRSIKDSEYENIKVNGFYRFSPEMHNLNHNMGFNLNYGELYLSSAVDPYFDLQVTLPFSSEGVELEEAYFTTKFIKNLQIKGGKFRSSFGRINYQHLHMLDFNEYPLVYTSFLGPDGLVDNGIQVSYLLPVNFYLLAGSELLQNGSENSFGTNNFIINTKLDNSGNTINIPEPNKPNVKTYFLKSSFDIGNLTILTGLSLAKGKSRISDFPLNYDINYIAGQSEILDYELTAKYFIDSVRYLSIQGEYLIRKLKGDLYYYNNSGDLNINNLQGNQSGYYIQSVYKFNQNYRAGIRYENLLNNNISINNTQLGLNDNFYKNLNKYTLMLEYNFTEFSRIRLEYSKNNASFIDGNKKSFNQFSINFNMAIGYHAAHQF